MTERRRSRAPEPVPEAAAQPALAARRPMARATQIALFEREVRERLSRTALDLVLSRAEVISEGQRSMRNGRDAYFGSTMLTIDLPSLELLLRDACDAGTARRLAALLETDAEAGAHVEALAGREAARVAGATPKAVRTHVAIRAQAATGLHRHRRRSDVLTGMDDAMYSFAGAAKILGVPESKLRYWAQVGFVGPSVRRGGKPLYSFQDLVSVKAAKELVDRGFKAAEIRKAIEEVRASLPHVDRPLDRMRVAFDGTKLVVVDEGSAFESTGQKLFDFGLAELAGQSSAPVEPAEGRQRRPAPRSTLAPPKRQAYDWFVEGTRAELSSGGEGDARAEQCYREALALDAGLAAARTNLGSLAYRRGDAAAAREAFEAALALDPDQPEARFNLANLVLENGDLELAVAELRRVLQTAPDFADAHYNLAVALERLGGRAAARAHLEHYLSLEPEATPWAEQARALIERLD